MMCVATTFMVLNGDLVGHMSFVKRKIIAKPVTAITRDLRCQNFLRILGFSECDVTQNSTLHLTDFSLQKQIW